MEPSSKSPFDRVKQAEEFRRLAAQYTEKAKALDPPPPPPPRLNRADRMTLVLLAAAIGLVVALVISLVV